MLDRAGAPHFGEISLDALHHVLSWMKVQMMGRLKDINDVVLDSEDELGRDLLKLIAGLPEFEVRNIVGAMVNRRNYSFGIMLDFYFYFFSRRKAKPEANISTLILLDIPRSLNFP
jgi:hypothetical protein